MTRDTCRNCLLLALLVCGSAWGAGDQYSLYLEAAHDESGTTDSYAEWSWGNDNGYGLTLGAGYTRLERAGESLDPVTGLIRGDIPVGRGLTVSPGYSHWGASQRILTDTLTLDLAWDAGDWRLSLIPEYRNIKLYSRPLGMGGTIRSRSFNSRALEAGVDYYGLDPVRLNLAYKAYDYSINPQVFTNPLAGVILSVQALTYSRGLTDHYTRLGVGYAFEQSELTVEQTWLESAVDGRNSNIGRVRLDWHATPTATLSLEAGLSDPDGLDSNLYGLLGLGLDW